MTGPKPTGLHLDVDGLPEGYIPLRFVALVECLTPEGTRELVCRQSEESMVWETIGMLEMGLALAHRAVQDGWADEDEED